MSMNQHYPAIKHRVVFNMIRPCASKTEPVCNVILDSGAYSAWRSGKPVNLDAYCTYLLKNCDWIGSYVALDVIMPGNPEEAAAQSFKNYEYMRGKGLDPIPVFHVGEDISWLHRMLDAGATYIGLSASSLVSRNKVDDWYATAWSHLVTADGLPVVKAHAFGEGRLQSLKRFPWYSADSTSWIYAAQRTGLAPMLDGRRVAMRNDGAHTSSAQDIDMMAAPDAAAFEAFIDQAGIDRAAFADRGKIATVLRTYLTAMFYIHCQTQVRDIQPIRFAPQGFFNSGASSRPAIDVGLFRFHLVVGTNNQAFAILNKLRHPHMLVSYFYIEALTNQIHKNAHEYVEAYNDPVTRSSVPWQTYIDILEKYTHA